MIRLEYRRGVNPKISIMILFLDLNEEMGQVKRKQQKLAFKE
jgi:hypothetical protein